MHLYQCGCECVWITWSSEKKDWLKTSGVVESKEEIARLDEWTLEDTTITTTSDRKRISLVKRERGQLSSSCEKCTLVNIQRRRAFFLFLSLSFSPCKLFTRPDLQSYITLRVCVRQTKVNTEWTRERERKREEKKKRWNRMAKQSSHHTSPTTVVVSTAGASAAAASLSTSATTAVTTSSNHLISASNGQPLNQIDHHDMLNASTFDEVPVNGNIDSLISSSSSFIQVSIHLYALCWLYLF